jgi:hypothetical protein
VAVIADEQNLEKVAEVLFVGTGPLGAALAMLLFVVMFR